MKSLVRLILVLMAVSTVGQALAARNPTPRSPICECVRIEGVISSIDVTARQIVVDDILVQVTDATYIHKGRQVISFDDLAIGQTVAVCGVLNMDLLTANRINVKYQGN